MLLIEEVKTKKQLKEFLNLPHKIYDSQNTRYVHPLRAHIKMMMGKLGTPQKHFFICKEGQNILGRIGIKVHRHHDKTTLNFGFFECDPSRKDVAQALIDKAHSLYPHLPMMGPFQFRMEDPYIGTLVEGFDRDPYFLMTYNPPEYNELLGSAGLQKAMDLFTYEIENPKSLSKLVVRSARMAENNGTKIRRVNVKNLKSEARVISEIFNDALSRNWGFEEFVEEQINEMVLMFKFFVDPRVVAIAQKNGQDVGCLIMIPNYNPLIKSSKGRLTPQLIWNYLRRKKLLNTVRGYALGVKRKYHGDGIGSALIRAMFDWGSQAGYEKCEISWVLANNGPMNELSKAMGGRHNKVYRIYERPPTVASSTQSLANTEQA